MICACRGDRPVEDGATGRVCTERFEEYLRATCVLQRGRSIVEGVFHGRIFADIKLNARKLLHTQFCV